MHLCVSCIGRWIVGTAHSKSLMTASTLTFCLKQFPVSGLSSWHRHSLIGQGYNLSSLCSKPFNVFLFLLRLKSSVFIMAYQALQNINFFPSTIPPLLSKHIKFLCFSSLMCQSHPISSLQHSSFLHWPAIHLNSLSRPIQDSHQMSPHHIGLFCTSYLMLLFSAPLPYFMLLYIIYNTQHSRWTYLLLCVYWPLPPECKYHERQDFVLFTAESPTSSTWSGTKYCSMQLCWMNKGMRHMASHLLTYTPYI